MENKLLVFLQEEVLNWPLRGKRKRENDDPDARLGASSVETYVSAVSPSTTVRSLEDSIAILILEDPP